MRSRVAEHGVAGQASRGTVGRVAAGFCLARQTRRGAARLGMAWPA